MAQPKQGRAGEPEAGKACFERVEKLAKLIPKFTTPRSGVEGAPLSKNS